VQQQQGLPVLGNHDACAPSGLQRATDALAVRAVSYERAAVIAKQAGNMSRALMFLRRGKDLQQAAAQLLDDFVDPGAVPPDAENQSIPSTHTLDTTTVAPPVPAAPVASAVLGEDDGVESGGVEGEAAEDDFDAATAWANSIPSHAVIEFELKRLAEKPDDGEDVEQRISALEVRKVMLEADINSGRLSLSDYIAALRVAIEDEKASARNSKASGHVSAALQTLRRAKIMSEEIAKADSPTPKTLSTS